MLADRAAYVYRNGVGIGRTPVSGVQTARRRRTAGLARRQALPLPGPAAISRVQDNATVAHGPQL